MTALLGRIRAWYGARPLHLLALIAAFAIAGYAVHAVVAAAQWRGFLLWFAVAIIGHDLLLFPLYSIADLSLRRLLPRKARPGQPDRGAAGGSAHRLPPAVNYVRIPAGLSLLLLMVWFPLILGLSGQIYHRASGLSTTPYLWRWLAVTGVLFTISAVGYAVAARRATAAPRAGWPGQRWLHSRSRRPR